jgi:serine protease Do
MAASPAPSTTDPSTLVRAAAERVGPSVVGLGRGWHSGSGVVVAQDRVLTVAHAAPREEVGVTFAGGRHAEARVLAVDPDGDLAVLEAETGDAPAIALGGASHPGLGAPVVALADPGGRGLRVTAGLVASDERRVRGPRGRRIEGAVEHTAPLPRGSSGGPLVDAAGALLGLNAVRAGGGLILAVPASRERVEALARGEAPSRVRLGLAVAPARAARRMRRAVGLPDRDGLLVRAVRDDGPAARAGVERGDLLVAAAGRPVTSLDEVHAALDAVPSGSSLKLTVVRGVEEREVEVSFP